MKSIFLLFFPLFALAQSPENNTSKIGKDPIFFIDSISVSTNEFRKLDSKIVGSVTVYKDKEATEIAGEKGKDGVIYIETIVFSKKRYWNFFISKSKEYKKYVPSSQEDPNVQYILNEELLIKDFEGKLASINDSTFKSIKIISKKDLATKYKILDKEIGVIIESIAN